MIFTRKILSGQYTVIPDTLVDRLRDLNLWTEGIVQSILASDGTYRVISFLAHYPLISSICAGSIQHIEAIPKDIRDVFKTVWEIEPEDLIKMAAARAPFVCQSQSMSLYFEAPTISKVVSRRCLRHKRQSSSSVPLEQGHIPRMETGTQDWVILPSHETRIQTPTHYPSRTVLAFGERYARSRYTVS